MEFYVLNRSFEHILVLDQYISAIWTERYFSCGDFEIHMPAIDAWISKIKIGDYIVRKENQSVMLIEKIQIQTDAESGNTFTISGRSAESMLERRVAYSMLNFNGSTAATIIGQYLLYEFGDYVNNQTPERIASEIGSVIDESGSTKTFQYSGFSETVYDIVCHICELAGIGFRFVLDGTKFDLYLYSGKRRTYDQTENAPVVFSPVFGNLSNSQYEYDSKAYRNVAMVYVLGETMSYTKRQWAMYVPYGAEIPTGLDRREIAVDGSSVKKDDTTSDTMYGSMLHTTGLQALSETRCTEAFSGDIDANTQFTYRKDWNLGDIVQVENEYGIKGVSRVLAVTERDDTSGYYITPTLSDWEV